MERTDRGEYVCEASNNVGPSVNMTAKLIVRWRPFCEHYTWPLNILFFLNIIHVFWDIDDDDDDDI